jgi:hypothetical protein
MISRLLIPLLAVLALAPAAATADAAVKAPAGTFAAGETVTVRWNGIRQPTARDWIGLYRRGATNETAFLKWTYTNGRSRGARRFTLPENLLPGRYELRLFSNNSYRRLARTPIRVAGRMTNTSVAMLAQADDMITVGWTGIESPTDTDWVGLYRVGESDQAFSRWEYTSGLDEGSMAFELPAGLPPGTYELRLFAMNGYRLLATSPPFVVS